MFRQTDVIRKNVENVFVEQGITVYILITHTDTNRHKQTHTHTCACIKEDFAMQNLISETVVQVKIDQQLEVNDSQLCSDL